jgi:hypothetical protein
MEIEMPKAAGADMKTTRLAPRPLPPSRKIMHQEVPKGPLVRPSAQAAPKWADRLEQDPAGGIDPRQMRD